MYTFARVWWCYSQCWCHYYETLRYLVLILPFWQKQLLLANDNALLLLCNGFYEGSVNKNINLILILISTLYLYTDCWLNVYFCNFLLISNMDNFLIDNIAIVRTPRLPEHTCFSLSSSGEFTALLRKGHNFGRVKSLPSSKPPPRHVRSLSKCAMLFCTRTGLPVTCSSSSDDQVGEQHTTSPKITISAVISVLSSVCLITVFLTFLLLLNKTVRIFNI